KYKKKKLNKQYKKKKKTTTTETKRLILEPLSKIILAGTEADIETIAQDYLNEEVTTVKMAIDGAKDIIAEYISDNPKYRQYIIRVIKDSSSITTTVKKNADDPEGVFEM